ncbi:RNA polymerase II transcription elongation factor-domain-containing protein [Aspergillus carlsbadensis]|nr:RNA polymerase II transcription elongation factor-domain-containing protein [Aspergillus carlsbadensis]
MAASALSGMIDPTKQAEYPIILGDRLAGKTDKSRSQLVNIQYNYKTKSTSLQQRSVITKSPHSRDRFNLTITDKAPNAEHNILTYSYQGSVDPTQSVSDSHGHDHNLVLVFDPNRKAFVLEPVSTQINFNLRSAPAKTQKQVIAQYPQLRTLQENEHGLGDDRGTDNTSGNNDEPPDDDNPYDFRHFLPKGKRNQEDDKLASGNATPEPYSTTSKTSTPLIAGPKPALSPRPRPKTQANPLRQKKPTTEIARHNVVVPRNPTPKYPLIVSERNENKARVIKPRVEREEPEEIVFESKHSPSDAGTGAVSSQKTAPSPGSNIIIDGDLIIDMGSPPPTRPFKVNPAHFSSNNTPANNDDEDNRDEDVEALRLPSPVPAAETSGPTAGFHAKEDQMYQDEEDAQDEDDLLAAEMEAAFEEEARNQQMQPQMQTHQYIQSDDESEVSEEE